MSANAAIVIFQNDPTVSQGIQPSRNDDSTYTDGGSFETYFNRAMTSASAENHDSNTKPSESKTESNHNTITHEAKTRVNPNQSEDSKKKTDEETATLECIEIPQDSIVIDENRKIQINVESLSDKVKEKLGIEDGDLDNIKVVFLTEEQANVLLNPENVSIDDIEKGLELSEAEQKLFAQQRLFFAQSNQPVKEINSFKQNRSGKTQQDVKQTGTTENHEKTLKDVLSNLEGKSAEVEPNDAETPQVVANTDDAKGNSLIVEIGDSETNFQSKIQKTQEDFETKDAEKQTKPSSIVIEDQKAEKNETKSSISDDSIVKEIVDSITSKTDTSKTENEENSTEDESVLNSKQHKLIDIERFEKTSGEISVAAANMAQTERVPQGPDVDLTSKTESSQQNTPEVPKGVFVIQVTEKDSAEDEKPQKVVLLARPTAEAKESKNDSAQTGKEQSGKDQSENGQTKKESFSGESLKDAARLAESVQIKAAVEQSEKQERQTKSDSSSNKTIAASEKESKSSETRKTDASLLQQSFKNVRDASVLEATNNPRPTQPVQTNTPQDQGNTQTQAAAQTSTTGQPTATSATSGQQTSQSSMVQHYAEKVAEVQEAAAKQIVRSVQGSIGSERSHITLRLTPESLGRVHIQMTMENGSLSAQITANKESTRAMLQQSMNSLKASFEESGIKVDRLVVNKESLDMKQNDLGRQNDSQDRSAKNQSGFDNRSGTNRQNQNGKQSKQQYSSWSDRMSAQDYFL